MVPLKWGDALSMLLPGAIALLGLRAYIPIVGTWVDSISDTGNRNALLLGGALLMSAAFAGGVLEALTRIGWERLFLVKSCPPPRGVLEALNEDPRLVDLYERGVQSSYKWVTAHANTAWALVLVAAGRVTQGEAIWSNTHGLIISTVAVLLIASYLQWTYFVNYQRRVFLKRRVHLP